MKPHLIAIIIPVHNGIDYTRQAIAHLVAAIEKVQDPDWNFRIVVVDDGSTDGTSRWLRQEFPSVHIISGDGSWWWSGSVNEGMKYAINNLSADFIIWWNNDIYPAADYFVNLVSALKQQHEPGIIGSKILVAEKSGIVWSFGGRFHRRWGYSYLFGFNQPDGPAFSQLAEADWLPGMGTVIPSNIVQQVGWIDAARFPQYHADIDYTWRARLAGNRIDVYPSLLIWNYTHHSGLDHHHELRNLMPSLRQTNSIHNFRKEWMFYRKHQLTPLVYLLLLKKYLAYIVRYLVANTILRFR